MVPPSYGVLQSSQALAQFMNNALSQRGASALPYSEDVKWYVGEHLIALVHEYPSLQVKTAIFTHNDGRTGTLLQADGTIPMFYNHVTYNIPVIIWLLEPYPRLPPCVYVNPTRDMIIRRSHPLVSPSGLVSLAYLQGWIFPTSNLLELVRQMGHLFGQDPPLYTKTPAVATIHRRSSSPSSFTASGPLSSSSNSSSSSDPLPNRLLSPYNRTPTSPGEGAAEVFKRDAVNKVVGWLNSDSVALKKSREAEMDCMLNVQAALRWREEKIDKGLMRLRDEKEELEQLLLVVLMNADVLEEWVQHNGEKKKKMEIDIDDVFEPIDALSRLMLECTAMDLAIEDIVYSLDKAIQEGVIPFDVYMRNIRALSREQFFHRATSAKVRAAQMQAQVATMASRASECGGV